MDRWSDTRESHDLDSQGIQYASCVPYHASGECAAILQRLRQTPEILLWLFSPSITDVGTLNKDDLTPFILRYEIENGDKETAPDRRFGFRCAVNEENLSTIPDAARNTLLPLTIFVPIHREIDHAFFLGCSPDVSNESSECGTTTRMVFFTTDTSTITEWATAVRYADGSSYIAHCVIQESGCFVASFILLPRSSADFFQRIEIESVQEWFQVVSSQKKKEERSLSPRQEFQDPSSDFYNAFSRSGILTERFHESVVTFLSPTGKSLGYSLIRALLQVEVYQSAKSTDIPLCETCCTILESVFEDARSLVQASSSDPSTGRRSIGQTPPVTEDTTTQLRQLTVARRARKELQQSTVAANSDSDKSKTDELARGSSSTQKRSGEQGKKRNRQTVDPMNQDTITIAEDEDRRYNCDRCETSFKRKFDRDRHISVVHLRQRNFDCNVCGRQFLQKGHLNTHILVVHMGIRRYQCDICQLRFGNRSNLNSHKKFVHKDVSSG